MRPLPVPTQTSPPPSIPPGMELKTPEYTSPLEELGGMAGDAVMSGLSSIFEATMRGIWEASLAVLRAAFGLADRFSVFIVDIQTGPISLLWPLSLWISGILAVGLFFWQLTMTSLRGGRGFVRLATGSMQYGIALLVSVGLVGGFLAAADALTRGILTGGLKAENFGDALNATSFTDAAADGIKAVVLGLCAVFGVLPAALGYVLEMLFREAAIYVLVASVPIVAAGLLAGVSAGWFWKTCRWLLATIAMKPVLALTLALGVAISGGSQGLSGLLAGVGVLLISLFVPFVLFRLFAFVDPNTEAGAGFRNQLSGMGVDSYGAHNPVSAAGHALDGLSRSMSPLGAAEQAHTDRLDAATAEGGSGAGGTGDSGNGANAGESGDAAYEAAEGDTPAGDCSSQRTADAVPERIGGGSSSGDGGAGSTAPPGAAAPGDTGGDGSGAGPEGPDEPPPELPGPGGQGPDGDDDVPGPGGGGRGGSGGAAGAAEDAAVAL